MLSENKGLTEFCNGRGSIDITPNQISLKNAIYCSSMYNNLYNCDSYYIPRAGKRPKIYSFNIQPFTVPSALHNIPTKC